MSIVVTKENCDTRPGAKNQPCHRCKKPFVLNSKKGWKATPVVVETEKISQFRGDDMVRFFHPECRW